MRWLPFVLLLPGCELLGDLFSTDAIIDASCAGDDTVVVNGRDLCDEFEKYGKIECVVGYRVRLDGQLLCP